MATDPRSTEPASPVAQDASASTPAVPDEPTALPESTALPEQPRPPESTALPEATRPSESTALPEATRPSESTALPEATRPSESTVRPESSAPAARERPPAVSTDVDRRSIRDEDLVVVMHDVSRRFGDRVVVRDIDLSVARGTILGIIGPSGAGKTTTIRMLTGGIDPTSGTVRVLGRPPKKFRRRERERIGYMPQLFTLYRDLTAGENVDFIASLFGMLFWRRRRRVREVLKVVDLWDARGRLANKLSGGMQRRLELACALVHEPELIILDEPTAGLDPLLRGSIWDELHRLRDEGRTLLVTTQHVAEAEECDAVAMIVGGRIIALAPPEELRRMATNGDLLDILTATAFDASDLVGMPGVRQVTQDTPRHLRVVVDDAGTALPQIVERVREKGVEIESAQEQRLSFDEIFAVLVARDEETRGMDATAGADAPAGTESRDRGGRAAA
jgi:ABC-2 type transport system ATP-binding protein